MTHTASKLQEYRSTINGERKRILATIEALHDELGTSLSDETEENGLETHLGDQGTMTFLRERDLSIEEHEEEILHAIDEALARMKQGTFGLCVDCHQPIPEERLEALPWAARCMEHQEALSQ